MAKFIPASFLSTAFNCPHCHAYAHQDWEQTLGRPYSDGQIKGLVVGRCTSCSKITIWYKSSLVYPNVTMVAPANDDMPGDLKAVYTEAANVLQFSPKASAALLRLALQKLCMIALKIEPTNKAPSTYSMIEQLVSKGLAIDLAKVMHAIRIAGNEAVHPGEIIWEDTPEVAFALFEFLNIVADHFLSRPKRLSEFYAKLPEAKQG